MGNILNLVFDNFDADGKPIPNLSHLNVKLNNDYLVLPFTILNLTPSEIKLNLCKPTDVDKDDVYYYFINHNCAYENLFNGIEWEIPSHIEYLVKTKNLRILFFNEHESFTDVDFYYLNLLSTIRNKRLNESLFYLVNNSSQLYETKMKYYSEMNVFKTNYLIELISKYVSVKADPNDVKLDKKFIFLCHNRRPKPHRVAILTLLNSEGLINEPDLIDWSLTYGVSNDYDMTAESFGSNIFFEDEKFKTSYQEITKSKKLSFFEQEVNWFDTHDNYKADKHVSLISHQESYINIVTESHFGIKNVHITEKTFKPFYYFQIPIFVSTPRHIEYLKKEHDLFLFEDFINHSYDLETDTSKRMMLIIEEIKRLSKLKDDIKSYYKSNIDKIIHNSNYIRDYKNKRQMDNFFISLSHNKNNIYKKFI